MRMTASLATSLASGSLRAAFGRLR